MASKKQISKSDDEIDIGQLLKKWWSFRKTIIFGTILITLLSTFILVLYNQTFPNQKLQFTRVILQGDLGKNNNRIIAALNSREYIQESLDILDIKLDPTDIINNLNVKNSTNALKESLQNRIISLSNKDISELAISKEALTKIYADLDNNSKNLIEIDFYHLSLNLSIEQSKQILQILIKNINEKILLRTNRDDIDLQMIDLETLNLYDDEYEQLARFSAMISSIQNNLSILSNNYEQILTNFDLKNYSSLANISQKLLYETSKKLGNTIAIDTLNIEIDNKNTEIEDLINSFQVLDASQFPKVVSSDQENNTNDNSSTNTTQLDGAVFDKILSIGSLLKLNNFRLETTSKIQALQLERSNFIKQKAYLNLPLEIPTESLNLMEIEKKLRLLSDNVNSAITQVRNFTEPKAALEIINNAHLVSLESNKNNQIKYVLILLSVLGLLILSIISILRPSR
jgi:hypothetical protein